MTTWRLMDGASGRPGAGSSGTQPPAAGFTGTTGNFIAGLEFKVSSLLWLQGFWIWVANTGQDTTAVKFALWQNNGGGTFTFGHVAGADVTSGTLTAGQWNFVPLASPMPLAPGGPYVAAYGANFAVGIPRTASQFGGGNPYAAGITNGPLFAYPSGVDAIFSRGQMSFSTAASDPASTFPGSSTSNLYWADVQVTDQPPPGTTYRAWPNLLTPWDGILGAGRYTIGMQYHLTAPVTLNKYWHYSPATSVMLPSECGIWDENTQALIPGTHLVSPAWKNASGGAASPGDGWVYVTYTGIVLPAGPYRFGSYANATAVQNWNSSSFGYYATTLPAPPRINYGVGGITAGPIFIPDQATAASPGQAVFDDSGSFAYPNKWDNSQDWENHWVDIEVTLMSSGLVMASLP